jgi:hypothetical protein
MRRWCARDPGTPLLRRYLDQIRQALPASHRTLYDLQVSEPPSFVKCGLDGCPTNARKGSHPIDWQVTHAPALDLAGNDAQNRALALGVVVPHGVRQSARAA